MGQYPLEVALSRQETLAFAYCLLLPKHFDTLRLSPCDFERASSCGRNP